MITIHHLGSSQSERIVWLCEELEIPYALKRYERNPATQLAPPEYKALHTMGTAPVITDGDFVLAESNAIVEYLLTKHAGRRLIVSPDDADYADYLYWLHFANGTMVPALMVLYMANGLGAADSANAQPTRRRLDLAFELAETRLGEAPYFGGSKFTAADIMMFSLLTSRGSIGQMQQLPRPHTAAYIERISARPTYRRASAKAEPDRVLPPIKG